MNRTLFNRLGLIVVLAAGIGIALYYRGELNARAVQEWVDGAGLWAPVVFMLSYIIGTVFFLPGLIFTITGGALFGPVFGTIYSLIGATIGATLAFIVARYIAGDWVREKAGGRLHKLMEGVADEGWRFVAFVRLVPLFPFNLLNYALGLTPIRLLHYVVATFIFMLPAVAAYTYAGFAGREAIAGGGQQAIFHALLALGLLAMVAFLPRIVRAIRNKPVPGEDT